MPRVSPTRADDRRSSAAALVVARRCWLARAPRLVRRGGAPCRREPRTVPEIAGPARAGRPVIFVGLDGADWELLDRLVADGTMPELARLLREGASGVLETQHPPLSPLVWTTMMTGLSPLDHTILDFTRFNPATGTKEPITSDERREPAVWNMASWAGRRVLSVGLWATYPAGAGERDARVGPALQLPLQGGAAARRASSTRPTARSRARARSCARPRRDRVSPSCASTCPGSTRRSTPSAATAAEPYAHPVSALRRILVETRVYDAIATRGAAPRAPGPRRRLHPGHRQHRPRLRALRARRASPRSSREDFERYHEVPARYFRARGRAARRVPGARRGARAPC